ncbi:hypothetical protein FBU30_007859 [Linnemannia zychae]|nr:hypothetical protein FBU30_007859 [Linnemannia zychae]
MLSTQMGPKEPHMYGKVEAHSRHSVVRVFYQKSTLYLSSSTRYMAQRLEDAGWYLRKLGDVKYVRAFAGVSTPFHGTIYHSLTYILEGLGPVLPPPTHAEDKVKYLSVMTSKDEIVTPFTSGYLDNTNNESMVKNVVVEDICPYGAGSDDGILGLTLHHVETMFSPVVFAVINGFLTPESERPSLNCQST